LENALPIVIVAGAAGNIGLKVARRLINTTAAEFVDGPLSSRPLNAASDSGTNHPTKFHIILMDSKPCPPEFDTINPNGHHVEYMHCDFTVYNPLWVDKFKAGYTAFLLSAHHALPDANSQEAYDTMLMNSNLLEACSAGNVERVVFGSSNHVVGGQLYKKGKIPPNAQADFGTKFHVRGVSMDSTLYASAKVAAEVQAQGMVNSGRLNRAIILRIGCVLPGENSETEIGITGSMAKHLEARKMVTKLSKEEEYILQWWKAMYLKTEDLDAIVDCCIAPGLDSIESKLIYVNAISENPNSRWIVRDNDLGYVPHSGNPDLVNNEKRGYSSG